MQHIYSQRGRRLCALLLLPTIILTSAALSAQEVDTTGAVASFDELRSAIQIGTFENYQLTIHDAAFTGLPGISCCSPGFTGGIGDGWSGGIVAQFPLVRQLAIQLRAGYSILQGELTETEYIGNALENGSVVEATVEHRIEPTFEIVSLEPSLSWAPFDAPLSINLGAQAGYMLWKTYTQSEKLLTPENATFANGSITRNESEGDIQETNDLYLAATAGLSYDIPLNNTIVFAPELSFQYNLSDIIRDSVWNIHSIRAGASIRFALDRDRATSVDPIQPTLAAAVTASGISADGIEGPVIRLNVEEFLASELRPLLNYVFFEENDADLPARYARIDANETDAFTIESLYPLDALGTYHQILNVIGRRMNEHPNAAIRLVGCNADNGSERGNTGLSRRRAEAVRDYLRDIWGIDEQRMKIEARGLPEKLSNQADADGIAENRRVEIYPSDAAIIAPIETHDTMRIADPPIVRFHPKAFTDPGIASWRLSVTQSDRVIREFSGEGTVPETIDWRLSEEAEIPTGTEEITYRLEIVDRNGGRFTTDDASIPIEQMTVRRKRIERVADHEINRFSLILFDFGKAEIGEANRRIIDLIRERIAPHATVSVTGYTDRVGDAEFNSHLSRNRAMATATALGVTDATVGGAGESILLHDNDLPEGRFYCRIVNVVVENPISQ